MVYTMKLTYQDIYKRCSEIIIKPNSKIFGIPKGGLIPASIIAGMNGGVLVDSPEESDYIIDDIVDSGRTKEKFSKYKRNFIALYENPNEWIEFPWELYETPAEDSVVRILQSINENPEREGLKDTPKRFIKYLNEFINPDEFKMTVFDSELYDEMVVVRDISFYSLCEHHILPFFGKGYIAYIPNRKILGLSKIPRILEKFSRNLQNQERITSQVANYINETLDPLGVGVVLKARHMCMEMRGIKKEAETITSKLIGKFKDDLNCRNEFMSIIK